MTDATILIPTYRHAAFLPYSIESALDQEGASVEVFVVGDGVEEATRDVIARYSDDKRLRYFDRPKGPRLGEAYRHAILGESNGRIVAYLSDDDLLLRDHAPPCSSSSRKPTSPIPSRRGWTSTARSSSFRGITVGRSFGSSHGAESVPSDLPAPPILLDAYRRLPYGWRTTPEGMPTDHWMWLQFLELPGCRAVMGERLTYLTFAEPVWGNEPDIERASVLAGWLRRSREPGFAEELDRSLREAIRRSAEDYHLWARDEQLRVAAMRATRTWRIREWLVGFLPRRPR